VGDLDRTADGRILGVSRVHQLTMGETVNWGPFWHPASTAMAYATSELGHQNYEVFLIDSARWTTGSGMPMQRDGSTRLRVTHAAGADVLPAFSADGRRMIWTSKRGPENTSQVWLADFALPLAFEPVRTDVPVGAAQPAEAGSPAPNRTP
jgi:Tol biopolymer transport system component